MHVTPRKDAKTAHTYYSQERLHDDDSIESWGDLGKVLGLRLQWEDSSALFEGKHPLTGASLFSTDRKRRSGWDITFPAPKTVSILWGLLPLSLSSLIETGHRKAVRTAIESFKRHAVYIRDHESTPPSAGGWLFHHGLSRTKDPHLHTHGYLLNIGTVDSLSLTPSFSKSNDSVERFCTTFRTLMIDTRWNRTVYAAYLSELARAVMAAGFDVRRARGTFSVPVVEPLSEEFSTSGEAFAKVARGNANRWRVVRPKKTLEVSVARMRGYWATRAIRAGFDVSLLTPKNSGTAIGGVFADSDDDGGRYPADLARKLLEMRLGVAPLEDLLEEIYGETPRMGLPPKKNKLTDSVRPEIYRPVRN